MKSGKKYAAVILIILLLLLCAGGVAIWRAMDSSPPAPDVPEDVTVRVVLDRDQVVF